MKKWLIIMVFVGIASIGISYGFSEESSASLNPEGIICCTVTKEGDRYGRSCTKVDALTYQSECETHYCKKVGNVYYDRAGNVTNKDNFAIECPDEVENENLVEEKLTNFMVSGALRVIIGNLFS